MEEKMTNIGGRLHDVSVKHTVTGANEVMDDNLEKKQDVINAEQQTINQESNARFDEHEEHLGEHDIHLETHDTEIAERYTKEEVNNIVSRTPETDVIVINVPAESQSDIAGWLDANTPSGTDPETGRSVRANKLYRVPGPDNTTFSEWAWNGTAYIMLANKDYGIDEEPIKGSNNTAKSGGIRRQIRRLEPYKSSHDLSFQDENGNAVVVFDKGHFRTKNFNSEESPKLSNLPSLYSFAISDNNKNNVLLLKDGHIQTKKFNSRESAKIIKNTFPSFDVTDENNNPIVRFSKGNIQTKNFDSRCAGARPVTKFIINCLGDSITYGYTGSGNADPTWPQGLSNNLGCITNNYGVSATSICNGSTESFVVRLNRMTETGVDVLLIFGGTNDFGDKRATTLGTLNDSPAQGTNFYASFKYLIEQAINKYPMAIIAVITPLRRHEGDAVNTNNISMEDIATAEVNVAKMYGCPVLDLYHHGTLNLYFEAHKKYYSVDGLHPNQKGIDEWLTPQITTFVKNLISFKTAIKDVKTCSADNLTFNYGHFIYGRNIYKNNDFAYTDYIEIGNNHNFVVPYSYDGVGVGYDENFMYVENYSTGHDYPDTPQEFTISNSVKYIRVNKNLTSLVNFYVILF